ncbi:Aconitate hydratase [Paenibacillus sp. P1XP2]|nr:Aconitate hydratase [Paenibacillus sp. P1XP2]
MMRGTFANIRIRNQVAPGTEGGVTTYLPTNEVMSIYDASMKYQNEDRNLVVIAGKEYGTGSSRDWAAKGTFLLGVKALSPKASNGFTAATSSAWACFRCSSKKEPAGRALA